MIFLFFPVWDLALESFGNLCYKMPWGQMNDSWAHLGADPSCVCPHGAVVQVPRLYLGYSQTVLALWGSGVFKVGDPDR